MIASDKDYPEEAPAHGVTVVRDWRMAMFWLIERLLAF